MESIHREGCKEFTFEPYEALAKNFLLKSNSIEIFDKNANKSYFFNFFSSERQKVVLDVFKVTGCTVIDDAKKRFKEMKFFEKWTRRKISSFDYLMLINKYASRSFNDTSQYPIMPWVGP